MQPLQPPVARDRDRLQCNLLLSLLGRVPLSCPSFPTPSNATVCAAHSDRRRSRQRLRVGSLLRSLAEVSMCPPRCTPVNSLEPPPSGV
jgi:hypothetical protein